jgi:hypothetical protein
LLIYITWCPNVLAEEIAENLESALGEFLGGVEEVEDFDRLSLTFS